MENRPVILVVDDEEPMLKLLRANLSVEGYQVVTTSDGMSALDLMEEYKPDLIVLDIMMPGQDGFQVLDLIRKRSSIPVIMLTAKSEVTSVQQALFAGADDYVIKPFSILVLTARIRAKLRRAIPGILRQNLQTRVRKGTMVLV
jgi:DNA-binding response OmpR family regulator